MGNALYPEKPEPGFSADNHSNEAGGCKYGKNNIEPGLEGFGVRGKVRKDIGNGNGDFSSSKITNSSGFVFSGKEYPIRITLVAAYVYHLELCPPFALLQSYLLVRWFNEEGCRCVRRNGHTIDFRVVRFQIDSDYSTVRLVIDGCQDC